MLSPPPPRFIDFLTTTGLVNPPSLPRFTPLQGGVSSDIWRVETEAEIFCIKSALPKLKVKSDWFAPIERNAYEVAWLQAANRIAPGSAPKILASDSKGGIFAMEYLKDTEFKNWKSELHHGHADPIFSGKVGRTIALIHSQTANDPKIAAQFPTDDIFHAIRLEPYLEATAVAHPALAAPLKALSKSTASHKTALVHGDVSPKNILVGPDGPKFLDAECAWYGDPAFDLAFCLNHMLLKCLWVAEHTENYLACFDAMAHAYFTTPDIDVREIERRAAFLLPGLCLGRIDGKSPVEYLTQENDKNTVRQFATKLLQNPAQTLSGVRQAWTRQLKA